MGLCKCEKRKVTLLFCFEHQVNVCEHCLLGEHSRCIVKTYVQWLQDADYNPVCVLCNNALADESCGDCVRLLCYDVVHWNCLNEYGENFPMNTAPAGYNCPVPNCEFSLFPAANAGSPLADVLRKRLATTSWARRALGIDQALERTDNAPPLPGPTDTSVERQSVPQSVHTQHDSAMRERPNLAVQIDEATDASELLAPSKEVRTNLGGASTRDEHSFASNGTAQGDDEKKRLRRSCLSEAKRVAFIQLGFCGLRPERCASNMSRCRPRPRRSLKIVMGAALLLLLLFLLLSAMNHNSKDESYLLPAANPNIHVLPD